MVFNATFKNSLLFYFIHDAQTETNECQALSQTRKARRRHSNLRHFQKYFFYIVTVNFIGGGNRSSQTNPPTCRKLLTNFIT
jgi:hypothetical protein